MFKKLKEYGAAVKNIAAIQGAHHQCLPRQLPTDAADQGGSCIQPPTSPAPEGPGCPGFQGTGGPQWQISPHFVSNEKQ